VVVYHLGWCPRLLGHIKLHHRKDNKICGATDRPFSRLNLVYVLIEYEIMMDMNADQRLALTKRIPILKM